MIPKTLVVVLLTSVLVESESTLLLQKHACKEFIIGRDLKEYTLNECLHAEVGYLFWDLMPSMTLHFPLPKGPDQELCFYNDKYIKVFDKNQQKIRRTEKAKDWKRCISFDDNDIVLEFRVPARFLKMRNRNYGPFMKFTYRQKVKNPT